MTADRMPTTEDSPRRRFDRNYAITAALFTALIIGIFIPYYYFSPVRVGDGSEYYAMFLAIKEGHHPWMTAPVFALYDALVKTQAIDQMIPTQVLFNSFPALHIAGTADFNHFWVYSLLAAGIARLAEFFGLALSVHHAFVTLHLALTLAVIWLSQALFGWRGATAATALLLLSPMVWYLNKVHTEYFTFCLILAAVMLMQARQVAWSAACLALASTQNPSFAIIALALLIWRVATVHRNALRFWELCAVVGTILLALVHPAYYYFRYGVLTPQLLAGGAKLGGNARSFSIWLLDPDLGLLPNWPLGAVMILICALLFIAKRKQLKIDWLLTIFIVGITLVNLFAQSSTEVVNSGATPGLARYALWYIPLFFPLALQMVAWISHCGTVTRASIIAAAVVYLVANAWVYDPRTEEDYTHPSSFSRYLQTNLPSLYNPRPDVYVGRFSGFGDSPASRQVLAVLGPSCDKLLVVPGVGHSLIGNPSKCFLDLEKIKTVALEQSQKDSRPRYIRFKAKDFAIPVDSAYETGVGKNGVTMLGEGWYDAENWGAWAKALNAHLSVPCPRNSSPFRLTLTLVAFNGERVTSIGAAASNQTLWSGKVSGSPTDVTVTVQPDQCVDGVAQLTLHTNSMESPKSLGVSNDERKLGIGLKKIDYSR